jgi:hypothetical protein
MQALIWLYEQHVRDHPNAYQGWRPRDGGDTRCYLCGGLCPVGAPSRPTREAIPDTFMEQEIVRCASSGWTCPACAHYLLDGVAPLVTFSHIVTPTTTRRWERDTMRADIEGWLATPGALPEPMVLAILTSAMKRRHVLPRAEVTTSGTRLTLRVDQSAVWVTPTAWRNITGPFDRLRALGHGKTEIVSGRLHPAGLARDAQAGWLAEALALSARLDAWRGHPALDLVAFVSPAQVAQRAQVAQVGLVVQEPSSPPPQEGTHRDGEQHREHGDSGASGGGAAGGLGRDRPRVQEQIPGGHLGATATPRRRSGAHDQRPADLPQPSLWDV